MPNKFLNADDTVDLIKYGTQNAALHDFENINDADSKILIKVSNNETVSFSFVPFVNDTKIIDWGDSTTTTYSCTANTTLTAEHIYEKAGYYIIRIPHIVNPLQASFNTYDSIKDFMFISPKTAPIKIIWTIAPGYNSADGSFGANAFNQCVNLEKVILDERWTGRYNRNMNFKIGANAFAYCKSLTDVKVYAYSDLADYTGSVILKIDNYAFRECVNLKCIDTINNSKLMGAAIFSGCAQLPPWDVITYFGEAGNINSIQYGAWYQMLDRTIYKDTLKIICDNADVLNNFLSSTGKARVNKLFITMTGNALNLQFVDEEIHISNTTPPANAPTVLSHVKFFVPSSAVDAYKAASSWSTYADRIFAETTNYLYTELDNKLSTTGGALTGDVTTTNTTFTNTSLVTKQYVDDTIANLNGNNTQY